MAADSVSNRLSRLSLRNHKTTRLPRPCHADFLKGTADPELDKRFRSHPDQVFVFASKVYDVYEISRIVALVFPTHVVVVRALGRCGQSTLVFVSHTQDKDIYRTREDIRVLLGVRPCRSLAVIDVQVFLEELTSSPHNLQLAHANIDQTYFSDKYRLFAYFQQTKDEAGVDWLRAPVPLSWDKMKAAMQFRKSLEKKVPQPRCDDNWKDKS